MQSRSIRRSKQPKLLAHDDIQARRTKAIATVSQITVQSLIKEAEEARQVAQAMGNSAGMTAAVTLKAKLSGLLTEPPSYSAGEGKGGITVIISADNAGLLLPPTEAESEMSNADWETCSIVAPSTRQELRLDVVPVSRGLATIRASPLHINLYTSEPDVRVSRPPAATIAAPWS
jgi:hypothetical protein